MFKAVKENISNVVFNRKLKRLQRDKQYLSFDSIKKVGIYIDLFDENHFNIVKEYVTYFSNQGKEVIVLGFYPGKELPNKYMLLQKFKFFTLKDFNFWGIPNKPVVNYFISKDHDLMIDCCSKKNFISKYVTGLSMAKLKAGYFYEDADILDFMINDGDKNDIKYLLDQLIFYLKEMKNN